jgi:CheY-like chemotaxis protein
MTAPTDRKLAQRTHDFLALHERIRCIDDEPTAQALLEELRHPSRPYIVSFVNAHAANLGWNTPSMLESLLRSDLLLRDGIGVKLGMKAFGRTPGVNMNGTDFIPKIARAYQGRRAALFGTRSPWLDTARQKLEAEGLVVVACHDGFAPPETYLELAAETKPELIILAMGMVVRPGRHLWEAAPRGGALRRRPRRRSRHRHAHGGSGAHLLGKNRRRVEPPSKSQRTVWSGLVHPLFLRCVATHVAGHGALRCGQWIPGRVGRLSAGAQASCALRQLGTVAGDGYGRGSRRVHGAPGRARHEQHGPRRVR